MLCVIVLEPAVSELKTLEEPTTLALSGLCCSEVAGVLLLGISSGGVGDFIEALEADSVSSMTKRGGFVVCCSTSSSTQGST